MKITGAGMILRAVINPTITGQVIVVDGGLTLAS